MKDRKKIVEILLKHMSNDIYCHICKYYKKVGSTKCNDCLMQEILWRLSRKDAGQIADEILGERR